MKSIKKFQQHSLSNKTLQNIKGGSDWRLRIWCSRYHVLGGADYKDCIARHEPDTAL